MTLFFYKKFEANLVENNFNSQPKFYDGHIKLLAMKAGYILLNPNLPLFLIA